MGVVGADKQVRVDVGGDAAGCIRRFVDLARAWCDENDIKQRDCVVIVPFAEHITPVRDAWARAGGLIPRVETTATLAMAARGGASVPGAGELTFDLIADRIQAAELLKSVPAMASMAKAESRNFSLSVDHVVQAAHKFARKASQILPTQREQYWQTGRELLGADTSIGMLERALAQVALEWAASLSGVKTDGVFDLRPAAWIVLKAGGADPVMTTLLAEGNPGRTAPAFVADTDPEQGSLMGLAVGQLDARLASCGDFEDEAQAAAAQTLEHINAGQSPVGLIALDRSIVRRVCALLRRKGVVIHDESGWKLSTTRPGTTVALFLRCAGWRATCNELLDWLKAHGFAGTSVSRVPAAVDSLEASMRRYGWTRPAAVKASMLSDEAAALWRATTTVLESMSSGGKLSVAGWLERLHSLMAETGDLAMLEQDQAGLQVLHALRIDGQNGRSLTWERLSQDAMLSFDEFCSFATDALEAESFVAAGAPEERCQVVVTPLRRAVLREFRATVFPGVDEKRLAGPITPDPLMPDRLLAALGLQTAEQSRQAEAVAFAQVLQARRLTLLYRRSDGAEATGPSALVRRLEMALKLRTGAGMEPWTDVRVTVVHTHAPLPAPAAVGPDLMPTALSASSIEALRDCPYKFFGMAMLGLREVDELDDVVEKRDYGTWLHAVLHRFHAERAAVHGRSEHEELESLRKAAEVESRSMGLDEAELIPFKASFEQLAPRYITWQLAREAAGIHWLAGEIDIERFPESWDGVAMRGRLDRMDSTAEPGGVEVLDYKTGSTEDLKRRANSGAEDTQMVVYGVLGPFARIKEEPMQVSQIAGAYVAIDDRSGIVSLPHEDVAASAEAFINGIGAEIKRIRAGEGLQALGAGRSCEYCSMSGLCRREHRQVAAASI